MSNYGSTRNPSLKRGERVIAAINTFKPEHISKRNGELKPAKYTVNVVSGTVLRDYGDKIYVRVKYPSGVSRDKTFHAHEVTLESKWHLGLADSRV
jgi:hypothetical protein